MAVNFINKYPYTDFHELNLDWIIKELSKKAAGRWVTITIHPDEWDNDGMCTVTGITGMTAETPFIWQWSPASCFAGAPNWGSFPIEQGDEYIKFGNMWDQPTADVTFYILIGE